MSLSSLSSTSSPLALLPSLVPTILHSSSEPSISSSPPPPPSLLPPPPSPLSPALIALALDYICPPSQLSSPLPPHFLSLSLLQRHHFLHLTPDDPVSYLAWPSDSGSHLKALRLLETFQKPIDDLFYSTYSIRYSADSESTYAHVAISPDHPPGLRLVFQWDSSGSWKYHNITLMPFPPNTFDSLHEIPPFVSLAQPTMTAVHDDSDDSYWDAYGRIEDSENPPVFITKDTSQPATEEAYWAQYATIHGSGDSTLPSPGPGKQKHEIPERIMAPYPGFNPSTVYNPLEPPSPTTLSRRLADLSPRFPSPPILDDSESTSDSNSITPSPTTISTELPSTHLGSLSPYASLSATESQPEIIVGNESHEALKDTIRSVYRLWKSGRRCSKLRLEESEGELFLDVVRQVIAE